ncbi:FAD-binding oxidoreductase [Micromonospora sp. NPDC049230]|uniref:FAD-binding oxidoreductase n=1 Tax=Micromonospora sp. NPDC049230 TaxID=3155502 RepID=UPI003408709B
MSNQSAAASLRKAATSVFLPEDEGYEEANTTWSLGLGLRPAAVVYPESADELGAVVRTAADEGLRVTPLGTGHNSFPFADLDDTVVLRTSRLGQFSIDAEKRRARVGAGTQWAPVVEVAGGMGLAGMHGTAGDVSIAGYHVGGGLSWVGRRHGLASSQVTAAELVLPDGSLVRVDADHEPDLFWAVRGGGGNLGIVTALEFGLLDQPDVYGGFLAWDLTRAPEVLTRWLEWSATAPDDVTTIYHHFRFPPAPEVPEPFRGRKLALISGVALADGARAERILAPLRELKPELDTFGGLPSTAVSRIIPQPDGPLPVAGASGLFDALDASAVDKLMAVVGADVPSSLGMELRQLGGALGRPDPDGGALNYLDGQYMLFGVGPVFDPAHRPGVQAEADQLLDSLSEYSRGRKYLSFDLQDSDPSRGYDAASYERLVALRRRVDPNGILRTNHEIR